MRNVPNADRLLRQERIVHGALRKGVRAAMLLYKRLRQPVVDWQDGKVVLVPPDKIDRLLREKNGRKAKAKAVRSVRVSTRR